MFNIKATGNVSDYNVLRHSSLENYLLSTEKGTGCTYDKGKREMTRAGQERLQILDTLFHHPRVPWVPLLRARWLRVNEGHYFFLPG